MLPWISSLRNRRKRAKMKHSLRTLTLGCSKNRVDTEHLVSQLGDEFLLIPEFEEDAAVDYLLINTCGFIGDAKQESINAILEAVEQKKAGLIGKIVVFGCLSQRYSTQMPFLISEVDAWFGARDLDPVLKYLGVKPDHSKMKYRKPSDCGPGTAYLKISEGCDRRCSYCAIPFIRGAHKSVPMESLLEEARQLVASGVKELILIAQDSTYYGLDLYKRRALGELIEKLSEIEDLRWIRIHYSYPDSFPEDVLYQMAHNPKLCRYLDIPLQHISDSVLSKMRRNVDSAWTRNLIRRFREEVPGVALRTTMIVGHPGEGEKEFEELLDFCAEARFERLGAFCYSEEEGTYGARHYKDEVSEEEKKRRYDILMERQSEISQNFNRSRVGTTVLAIVDDVVSGKAVCRSEWESPEVDGEIWAELPAGISEESLPGSFVKVRIKDCDLYDLFGEIVSVEE